MKNKTNLVVITTALLKVVIDHLIEVELLDGIYSPLVEDWFGENTNNLNDEDKEKVVEMVIKNLHKIKDNSGLIVCEWR